MLRHNHYEAAFEDLIRSRGWPYVPVDEQRRAIFAGARIKSFDFIVYRPGETAWLVDTKGRKLESAGRHATAYRENWVTREDLEDLQRWREVFGCSFEPVLVFVYWLVGRLEWPEGFVHEFRGRHYSFEYVTASSYQRRASQRSPKWETVKLYARDFRDLARPLG